MPRRPRWAWGCLALALLVATACDGLVTPPPPTPTVTPAQDAVSPDLSTPTLAPEIYLTPIPPTPTFTPSPTPTPVLHIVEQGDTLFGIALEYGVTVSGLLQANGLSEDDFLRIGQALIIPLEEDEDDEAGGAPMAVGNMILPTPTPLALPTDGVAIYETPVGGAWCMGEVVNTTGGPVTNLQVEVTLLGPDGSPLISARSLAAADYLPPEGRAPFSVLFREPPAGFTDARVRLVRGEALSDITAGFTPLAVVETAGSISGPQYRVRGAVVNTGEQSVTRLAIVATIYNAAGDVVGYRQVTMGEEIVLAPGQQHTFDLLLTPQEVTAPESFDVLAWAVTL
jgi:LysM repeat protein